LPGANNQTLAQIAFTTNLCPYFELTETWLAFVIILGISMAVIVLRLIYLRNRIRLAIALIGHASKYVENQVKWHFLIVFFFHNFCL
jgi:choline transporter-like protein 2/4/5